MTAEQAIARHRIREAYRKRNGHASGRGFALLDSGAPFPNRSREEARRRTFEPCPEQPEGFPNPGAGFCAGLR